ncbi:3-oxoacyl-[acyl-carrier-protein] reductase FabG [Stieleria maiorica]|uniref:3-oxoacyl-[acyl-carrier-protein] reductase FabG n=2 Tax=Stieleria maiorica TaxID=2795974 RepID=A0A5B9MHK1_9BACT|nr:3-oxoacyl-[acyl-carrier-protein] reductase FabG [Stieleria maiorica]
MLHLQQSGVVPAHGPGNRTFTQFFGGIPMLPTDGNVLDSMLQCMRQATEANLRLQQDLLRSWTRYWPGFTARPVAPMTTSTNPNENGMSTMITKAPELDQQEAPQLPSSVYKNIREKVAVVTGAASGIGEAVARELANRGAKAVMLVDRSDAVQELAKSINQASGREVAEAKLGDTTDEAFRKRVFNEAAEKHGIVTICVPAAGITRDALSVTINKETGRAQIYPTETFRQVTEVNLIAPIYWGIEMVARIAEDRRQRGLKRWDPEETIQGVVVFLGSVSSQGNKGQISYAVAKAGLEGAAATLTKEAIFHGVRCGIIHPGFTDTPMARALGQDFLDKNVLPYTQLRRLIKPEEIADAICFMISNSAVSGELWADAGWHGPA